MSAVDREEPVVLALRRARAELTRAPDERVGESLEAIDRALRSMGVDPEAPTTDPPASSSDSEVEALRRELERQRAHSPRGHELLDAILHHSPHGVIVCDARGKLLLQNRAAERIWAGSASAQDVEGWGAYRAFHPDGRAFEPHDWSMARCLASGAVVDTEEVHIQRFDGTHGVLLGSAAPLFDARGRRIGAISVFADVTPFKSLEALKDRWVAVASHEIRNFLAVVKIRVDMAARANERKSALDLGELLGVLKQSVDELNALLGDMLDLSRAHAGTLPMHFEEVPLDALVRRVAEPLIGSSGQHTLKLTLEPVMARADPLRCEQIVQNLVQNALRYSPSGGVVHLRIQRDGDRACVEIVDSGVGFEPAAAERLFEPFVRLENIGAEGMGVGLFLARELVQRMGGRISARSEGIGKGATFRFTLPIHP